MCVKKLKNKVKRGKVKRGRGEIDERADNWSHIFETKSTLQAFPDPFSIVNTESH